MSEEAQDLFVVVVNEEGQYSIWPEYRAVPAGWEIEGEPGTREECLDYVERVWTDMTPASLRPIRGTDGDG